MNRVQRNPAQRKSLLDYVEISAIVEISVKVMKRVLKLFFNSDVNGLEI